MKKRTPKKVQLSKETVRTLNLVTGAGGDGEPDTVLSAACPSYHICFDGDGNA